MSITIREVAKEAGVSIATVSKVINDSPSISESTKERVQKVMEQLSYYPNQRAQNFAKKRSNTIAFITNFQGGENRKQIEQFDMMSGILTVLEQRKFALTLFSATEETIEELLLRLIAQQTMDGIILEGTMVSKRIEAILVKEALPHVICGKTPMKTNLFSYKKDHVLLGEMATRYAIGCGYTTIGILFPNTMDGEQLDQMSGIQNELRKNHIFLRREHIKQGDNTKEQGRLMMNELLEGSVVPDAILCVNSYVAAGVLEALTEHKLQEKIGVIALADLFYSKLVSPTITTAYVDEYDTGVAIAKYMVNKVKHKTGDILMKEVTPQMYEGDSTKNGKILERKHEKKLTME